MSVRSVSEARATLPELLDRVEAGEEVTITRHGKPVAVMVKPDRLRHRRAEDAYRRAASLHDELESAGNRSPMSSGGLSPERADELISELRTDRDGS